ncbi:MAG: sodium-dependent transporter [Verrucomicrobia bacterium]|nr:sodium-dependent transporter [Verrucomicrobiota bacterium]
MEHLREHWGSRFGFMLAAAGSAIGLGSLWKFPYVAGDHGGGAFVLVYLLATLFICVPLFICELVMGRATQRGAVEAFSILSRQSQNWKGMGWLALTSTLVVYSYYAVVSGWTLNYVILSLSNFTAGKSPEEIRAVFDLLLKAGGMNLFWQFGFLLLTAAVVWGGVRKGIEHWAKILTPALLAILIALFFYAITMPGFHEALRFLLIPDFSKVTPSGILSAVGLSFFTASLGFGIILTYGSYLRPDENLPSMTVAILGSTLGIALIAALTIFPIVFSFGFSPSEGPGLVFKVLPVLFSQLPAPLLISTLFFLLLVFTALTSTVSLLENMTANCIEQFQWSRKKSIVLSTLAAFMLGVPSALAGSGQLFPSWQPIYNADFFATISTLWDRWFLPLSGLLISIFVGYVMDRQLRDKEFLGSSKASYLLPGWLFLIRYVVPIVLILLILEGTNLVSFDALIHN